MKTTHILAAVMVSGGLLLAGSFSAFAKDDHPTSKPKDSEHPKSKPSDTGTPAAAKVGDMAPAFTLKDTDGKEHTLADFKGKTVVIEWYNPGCPFIVKHHSESKNNMTFNKLYEEYNSKGVVFLAINSSAPGKEGHGLEMNKKKKEEYKLPFPVLLDESGDTGRAYGAKTTPHCYVINAEGKIVYAGAIDNNKNIDKAGDKNYVKAALDETLAGKAVTEATTAPYGCSVKYAK